VKERTVIERQDLSRSPAAVEAVQAALDTANVAMSDFTHLDIYSCFPIAVSNIADAFGLSADDPRGLTVTGGLPFFGGAGNNYSMHAIAEIVRRLRKTGGIGLIGANGGFLSKYSVGVYGTEARPFKPFDSKPLQAGIDAWPAPVVALTAGEGTVTTYTIDYSGPEPRGMVIGQTPSGERFVAMTDKDSPLVQRMIDEEPLGAQVTFAPDDKDRLLLTGFTPSPSSRT